MKIDGEFYFCEGCHKWQPWMGNDVSCDCGHSNNFTDNEIEQLEEAVVEAEENHRRKECL